MNEQHCVNMLVPHLDVGSWFSGMGLSPCLCSAGLGTVPWLEKAFHGYILNKCIHGFLFRHLVLNHPAGLGLYTNLSPAFGSVLIFVHL